MKKIAYSSFLILLMVLMVLISCNRDKSIDVKENTGESSTALNGQPEENDIKLTREQFRVAGMQLGKIEKSALEEKIRTNGMLDVPINERAIVSTPLGGFIAKSEFLPGDWVDKGQLLTSLENPEFVRLQQDFLKTREELDYLKSVYDRQVILSEEQISSQNALLKAKSDYFSALASFNSLEKILKMMNVDTQKLNAQTISSYLNIYSPISGNIVQANAVLGGFVNPSDIIFQIINTQHLHLELLVFEKDITKIKKGQEIRFNIPEISSREFKGQVFLIGKNLDENNRTIDVHGHITEEVDFPFIAGMFVQADILINTEQSACLPSESFVNEDGNYFIFIKKSESANEITFSKIQVNTGKITEKCIEIIVDNPELENREILIKGAFNLMI